MIHNSFKMKLSAVAIIAFCALVFNAPAHAQLNPNTSSADIKASGRSADRETVASSLRNACREQLNSRPYSIEYCRKKCSAGEKRFCACAKNPCVKFEKDFEAEAAAAAAAKSTPPPPSPSDTGDSAFADPKAMCDAVLAKTTPIKECSFDAANNRYDCRKMVVVPWEEIQKTCDSGKGSLMRLGYCDKLCSKGCVQYCKGNFPPAGTCSLPDNKLPDLEGYSPDHYAMPYWIKQLSAKNRAESLEIMCRKRFGPACKALCQVGCKEYCDICAMSKNGEYVSGYRFVTEAITPNGLEYDSKHVQILHNCNPKTKKRGVGIIPGNPESFIGVGYGMPSYCKGYCHEEIGMNWGPLRRAFDAGELGNKEEYDGVPTYLELIWAGGHLDRCGSFFSKWLYPYFPGWSQSDPIRPAKYSLYDQFAPLVTIRPGLHSYQLPRYPDGSHRYMCGKPVWIDSTGASNHNQNLEAECRGGSTKACGVLCERGAGFEQFCALKGEMSDLSYCKRYGGSPNTPSCKKLCDTGKPEYRQYCPK